MPKIIKIEATGAKNIKRKRVADYARVSEECEQLLHSLAAQVSYYSNLIQSNPEWEYAGVYADEGISGVSIKNRKEFQRLLADCAAGKIDLVLTKSISRFARNTVDLLETVRHLKEIGVEVRFERENISTFTADGETFRADLIQFHITEHPVKSHEIRRFANVVDSPEKIEILEKMFSRSAVAAIYGSAGVGKSTLINHISHFYEDKQKLFLAQTNPAIDNLRRRVTADQENCTFSTIASLLQYGTNGREYDLLVIDECSTVNNKDMRKLLETVSFQRILLVGDTYQINSIRFGNWFSALRYFLPETSVFELTKPYRTNNQKLLILWAKVRAMDDNVQEIIDKQSYSLKVDETLLTAAADDEVVLCLNYDGLYGINNINRFLQESNPNPAYEWDVQQYKVGDPVLFLDNNRFRPVIYNNMRGKIVGIKKLDVDTPKERIRFDIELNTILDEDDAAFLPLDFVENPNNDNSIVRFCVYKTKSTDEDDDGNTSRTIVPFQIAYAVSIHKAQGLEYNSVKIVITDEVDELITHSIFYTAITRAQKDLKIYWTPEVEKKVLERIRPRNIDADVEVLKRYITKTSSAFRK